MEKFKIKIGLKCLRKFPPTLLIILIFMLVSPAAAQLLPTESSPPDNQAQQAPGDPLGRSTPFGTFKGFIAATHREDYALAARYLDTTKRGTEAQELAKQLMIVLDQGLTKNLEKLSRNPEGDLQDDLPNTRDLVGIADTPSGKLEIFMDRIDRPEKGAIWLFSSDTLELIPEKAKQIGSSRLEELEKSIPSPLVRIKVFSYPLYQYIVLILALVIALVLGALLTRALVLLLRPPLRRLTGEEDDRILASIKTPIRLILISAFFGFFSLLAVTLYMRRLWAWLGILLTVLGLSWLLIQFSRILFRLYERRLRYRQNLGKIAMWGLLSRLFNIMVVIVAALWLLNSAGVNLTAILTGLGVGGIAVALAAQKTLENLIGGMSIISDEPVGVGDFCQIEGQMGVIEDIGLRSTRIRTLSRTVVVIPNGQLAAMNVENFSRRDKFWLRHLVGLRYETSADQLRYVLAEIHKILCAHPKVYSNDARIRFVGFGGSSLDLEIFAYVKATEMPEFLTIQEDLLLRIMDLIDKSGSSIAFPSQTTYLSRDSKLDSQKTEEAEMEVRRWRESGEFPFPEFHLDQGNLKGGRGI